METPNLDIGGVNSSPKATTSVNDGKKESKHSSSKNGRKHTSSNLEAPRKQQGSTHNDTRTGKEDQKGDLKHEIRALDHDDGEEGGSGGEEGGHISMTFPQKASSFSVPFSGPCTRFGSTNQKSLVSLWV